MPSWAPHGPRRSCATGSGGRLKLALAASRFRDMGIHINTPILLRTVKTTVEISDPLLREVRKLAARQGVTLRTLIERGLHRVIADTRSGAPFKLRRVSFKGCALQPEFRDAPLGRMRDAAYEDHGA
jgi:hypothetical protein